MIALGSTYHYDLKEKSNGIKSGKIWSPWQALNHCFPKAIESWKTSQSSCALRIGETVGIRIDSTRSSLFDETGIALAASP